MDIVQCMFNCKAPVLLGQVKLGIDRAVFIYLFAAGSAILMPRHDNILAAVAAFRFL